MQSEGAYAYAKACGIIGKSFLGKRQSFLDGIHSLGEFDRLVFPDPHYQAAGKELLVDMEKRIIRRAVKQILSIVDSYSNPPELLIRMLRVYEYHDLKMCLHKYADGQNELSEISDLGRFRSIRFNLFPDFNAMLAGTEFDFLLSDIKQPKSSGMDMKQIEVDLDTHYYKSLAKSLVMLSTEDSMIIKRIIFDEISLRNCALALRLRTYYQKTALEIKKFIIDINIQGRALAYEAFTSLKIPLDIRASWKDWKWEKFLNPEKPSAHWIADPRYFQNAASLYLARLAMNYFHSTPMEISSIFCFIKLKQFEEDLLTSVAEGLSLGLESSDVLKMLEVS